jgi:hypothetical protein
MGRGLFGFVGGIMARQHAHQTHDDGRDRGTLNDESARRWCILASVVALISGFVFFLIGGPHRPTTMTALVAGLICLDSSVCKLRNQRARGPIGFGGLADFSATGLRTKRRWQRWRDITP